MSQKKKFQIPHVFVILVMIVIFATAMTYIIPAGEFARVKNAVSYTHLDVYKRQESVRGDDLYIMVDVCNYNMTYTMNGLKNHMSPDDHYQDLKRVIAAVGGKGRRINVIMPFLYESRQHKRTGRESLDLSLIHI